MPPSPNPIDIGPEDAVGFLRAWGWLPPDVPAMAELLTGGVSNVVLRVRLDSGEDLVIKQSRPQLRTRAPWFSRRDRIFREIELMRLLRPRLPTGMVPRVLFEDRAQYLFGMEAVPADHVVWKADLLAGRTDPDVAARMGECLATIHRSTAADEGLRRQWADREVFLQLRVDPYYRHVADAHPRLKPYIERLIAEMMRIQACIVHADFSPKNILLHPGGPTLVDYETGHYGDPAFDLGFFLTHLMLKAVFHGRESPRYTGLAATFWQRYVACLEDRSAPAPLAPAGLERRAAAHLAACMLARIDGKSPVEYLTNPEPRDFVRALCRELFEQPPRGLEDAFSRLERRLTT